MRLSMDLSVSGLPDESASRGESAMTAEARMNHVG